jgi:hypothetical protein
MKNLENKYQNIVVQGWVAMLFLLLTMFITDIVELAMKGDYTSTSAFLSKDPGMDGLWFLAFLICFNVLVQMAIRTISCLKFRWLTLALTISYGLFFLAHQVIHLLNGEGYDIHFVIDVTHHIIAIWATCGAYKWLKEPA